MKKIKKITMKELERRIQDLEENDAYNHYANNYVTDVEVFEIDEDVEEVRYSCKVYKDQSGDYEYFNDLATSFESLEIKVEDIEHLL